MVATLPHPRMHNFGKIDSDMALPVDISGQRFGRLIAVAIEGRKRHGRDQRTKVLWRCQCDCGQQHSTTVAYLRGGHTKSCGCLKVDNPNRRITHGNARGKFTREYRRWRSMFDRCYRPKQVGYKFYGGRGITICDRWRKSFSCFLVDMGPCPDGYSLDRINPNGNYEPDNCRWIPLNQQARNTRANVLRDINNRPITWAEAAHHLAMPDWTLRRYMRAAL